MNATPYDDLREPDPIDETEDLTEEGLFLERATAYWLDEMSPEERQAFEHQMRSNPDFRDQAETWRVILTAVREWLAAPAPGVEEFKHQRQNTPIEPLMETNVNHLPWPWRWISSRKIREGRIPSCPGQRINSHKHPTKEARTMKLIGYSLFLVLTTILGYGGYVSQYLSERTQLKPDERLAPAILVLNTETDPQAVDAALNDLERLTLQKDKLAEGFQAVDAYFRKIRESDATFAKALLIRARMLYRLGNEDEAGRLFETGMVQYRFPDAFPFYIDTLKEAGKAKEAVAAQYQGATRPEVIEDSWRNFIGQFYDALSGYKKTTPQSAVDTILPLLQDDDAHPEYKQIAEALCLLADGRYGEAMRRLDQIEADMAVLPDKETSYSEWRNIPLYRAAVEIMRDNQDEPVRQQIHAFWERNQDRPPFVAWMAMALVRIVHSTGGEISKRTLAITQELVDLGFSTNPQITSTLSEYTITHLLDHYQMGLLYRGKWRESKSVCMELITKYFPRTHGAVNAMNTMGMILEQHEHNYAEAEKCYRRVILESPFDVFRKIALGCLHNIKAFQGESPQNLVKYLEELRAYVTNEESKKKLDETISEIKSSSND